MRKNSVLRTGKMIYLGGFLVGFIFFLILGKNVLDDNILLDVKALREVKDSAIDKGMFFQYIFWRRWLILILAAYVWWKGFGKWLLYALLGYFGISMGICMYTCLLRYHIKGLFLWFALYLPHALFYAAALFLGIFLIGESIKERQEKIKFLWQKWFVVFGCLLSYILGMYAESYLNVPLMQSFLQFF